VKKKKSNPQDKKMVLGSTKQLKCEMGEDCNYYYKCFDDRGNPTDKCAINYCERYAGENSEETENNTDMNERINDIINNFVSYDEREDDYEDNGLSVEIESLDDIIRALQDFWYMIQNSKRVIKIQKVSLEMAIRLLELYR